MKSRCSSPRLPFAGSPPASRSGSPSAPPPRRRKKRAACCSRARTRTPSSPIWPRDTPLWLQREALARRPRRDGGRARAGFRTARPGGDRRAPGAGARVGRDGAGRSRAADSRRACSRSAFPSTRSPPAPLLAAPRATAPLATPGSACEDTAARLLAHLEVPASEMPPAAPPGLDELAASGRALRQLEAGDLRPRLARSRGQALADRDAPARGHRGARRKARRPR